MKILTNIYNKIIMTLIILACLRIFKTFMYYNILFAYILSNFIYTFFTLDITISILCLVALII